MSRYSGQHRTPSISPNRARTFAVLGTAGALAAAPIGLAGPAQAASGSTWDRLANCESGGNWAISTGNGYSGGLQFAGSTWRAYGGGSYSSSARGASRSEQIAIAEKVLDAQGWDAWPACSRRLGLGRAEAAGSPTTSRSVQRTALHTHKKAQRKAVTKKTNRAAVTKNVSATRSAKATTRQAKKRSTTMAVRGAYVVRSGDTLSRIANRKDVRGGWKSLYVKNRGAIGSNPNVIRVGQRLALPR